jgi:hypothetical protein
MTEDETALYEQLAAIEHQRWADWQHHVHNTAGIRRPDGSILLPAGTVARWERQISTDYAELSEQEKQSDRDQVDRYWHLIVRFIARSRLT